MASLDELASGEVYEQIGKVGTALMQSIRDCAATSGSGLPAGVSGTCRPRTPKPTWPKPSTGPAVRSARSGDASGLVLDGGAVRVTGQPLLGLADGQLGPAAGQLGGAGRPAAHPR